MLLLDKLKSADRLTNTEQRIATYILNNMSAIPTITIDALATATYTSHSAIVRLSKKLGYTGFRDLKLAILETIHKNLNTLDLVDTNFPFTPSDSAITIAKKISDLTNETVSRTLAQLNEKELNEAASIIDKAKRIFLFALGDSQIRARSFQNKLAKINKFATIADQYGDANWVAVNIETNDCAIFISYGTQVPLYHDLIHFLNAKRIPTLLITGNANSELIKLALHSIIITQNEHDYYKISTFSSQIAFEYILDTLFSIIYSHGYQRNLVKLKNEYTQLEKRTRLNYSIR